MQLVQDIGSGDNLALGRENFVTEPSISKQKGALLSGLNRLSERQQQALLLCIGLAWMGLVLALAGFTSQPKRSSAADAKAVPVQVIKPAGYAPQATKPLLKAAKS